MNNHNADHHHDHNHCHEHDHSHAGGGHHHGSHDNLLESKAEAAAFIQYTLEHNKHHLEELSGLAHSLQHLNLVKEAQEVRLCIDDIGHSNKRLESVLDMLKDRED